MKLNFTTLLILLFMTSASINAQKSTSIKGEEVSYLSGGKTMKSYVAYDEKQTGKRPAIIVVPEWWGINDYTKTRAKMLAELGYIAIAVDMYGEGKIAADPKEAGQLATPFYEDFQLDVERIEAAANKLKEYPQTDTGRMAAIGYCFGGSMVLNAAKLGMDLKGVVSFHGGLATVPATEGTTKAAILVCHGAADKFISPEEIKSFRDNLDSMKVPYTFKEYKGATHAFSNPAATTIGKKFNMPIEYNEAADKQSWQDMKDFFKKVL
ncbi:MAG: dienelactone hydrolase family protein [Ferruginibacter sp.]